MMASGLRRMVSLSVWRSDLSTIAAGAKSAAVGPTHTISGIAKRALSFEARKVEPTDPEYAHQIESSEASSTRPTKETLLRVDWLLEHQVPGLLKARIKPFFDACVEDVCLEDGIYNYNIKGKANLLTHIAKVRMYFRYMSPFNKVERFGSCVYAGDDVVTVLWKLSTLESSFFSYLPTFISKKEQKIHVTEGALDVHVTKLGYAYKLVNRKITAADREGALVMEKLKTEAEKNRRLAAEKEMQRSLDDDWHRARQQ